MLKQLTISAADAGALINALLDAGLFVNGETGQRPAPGVTYSFIGDAALGAVTQAGKFGFVAFDEAAYPTAVASLGAKIYNGPALRQLAGVALQPAWATVTPRQFCQALNAAGLRANVEAMVAAQGQDVKDWWERASSFERSHPLVVQFGQSLGQSSTQLDGLFQYAASL